MIQLAMEEDLRYRLTQLHTLVPDSIGDLLHLQLESCDESKGEYLIRGQTHHWMRNIAGTLHGGMCATLVDQAMGCVSYCAKPGKGIAPTIELQVSSHRPLIPGEDVLILVRVLSVTHSLIRLTAEASLASAPDKVCLTSSATYFYKPAS